MATVKNYKTYIIIDYTHEIYGFVNSPSDIDQFYTDNGIDITTLPKDANNYLTGAVLVNVKTKQEIPVLFSSGNALCI